MDYDAIAKAGSMLGSGAVIVMDETRCMVKSLMRLSYFYFEESCGQCTPCREGTGWLYRMVHRIETRPRAAPKTSIMLDERGRQHHGAHHLRAGRRRARCRCAVSSSISAMNSRTTSSTRTCVVPHYL